MNTLFIVLQQQTANGLASFFTFDSNYRSFLVLYDPASDEETKRTEKLPRSPQERG